MFESCLTILLWFTQTINKEYASPETNTKTKPLQSKKPLSPVNESIAAPATPASMHIHIRQVGNCPQIIIKTATIIG